MIISISGKGGTGKTILTALTLKVLMKKRREGILVVDADPSTNLPEILGVKIERTVGDVVSKEFKGKIEKGELPPEVDKRAFLESLVIQTLIETPKFDLLAMGRTEGEGCYCLVNTLLTDIIDTLSKNYSTILMDMEAGLEHVSRRTDRDVDVMIIITDPTKMGFLTVKRIHELAKEVHIEFKKIYVVGNMFPADERLYEQLSSLGIEVAGTIPYDLNVAKYALEGKPLIELPDTSPAVLAVEEIVNKIGL